MKKPVALIIRDGWGLSPRGAAAAKKEGNAPLLAHIPYHDYLLSNYPLSHLSASGEDVGLPEGQMGNSEVGHMNLGAGRIVYQDLTRINLAVRNHELGKNPAFSKLLKTLVADKKALHLWGLLSDGGVHSHEKHLYALIEEAKKAGLTEVYVHAFMDGRDTSPTGGAGYIKSLLEQFKQIGVGKLATFIGRYYAMDRDQRWDRNKLAWDLLFSGVGEYAEDPIAAIEAYYKAGKTDEFLPATVCIKEPRPIIRDGDGILFFNYRSDRARQLSRAILDEKWDNFPRPYHPKVHYVTMTEYDAKYTGLDVMFGPETLKNILAEVVSKAGKTQVRLAETEKYPHVTYFFNGGVEIAYPGEDREMVPSPKVATYDLKPEMSAYELTEKALARLEGNKYDLFILNYANPDMVGHTGILPAAIKAVETVDECCKKLVEKILSLGGCAILTADHGNCEWMITDDGKPQTAHTTNLVEFIYVAADAKKARLEDGILADVAPTLLYLLDMSKPAEMTGHSLITISK
jgi:2,3-bisphosphoglycerate-independent phosphoglycerate mutase